MRVCAVVTCKNKGVHLYPTEETLKQQWIEATGIGCHLRKNSHICSDHFIPSDFVSRGKRITLKRTAVPSIFPWTAIHSYSFRDVVEPEDSPFELNFNPVNALKYYSTSDSIKKADIDPLAPTIKPDDGASGQPDDMPLEDNDDRIDGIGEERHSVSNTSCQEDDDDLSMSHNLPNKPDENKHDADHVIPEHRDDIHIGFICNKCSGEIRGYRYRCVQCVDYDLCAACEAKGVHCLHYVLRIPGPRPYLEIQTIVNKIREQLQYGVDAMLPSVDLDSDIKKEVEEGDPLRDDIRATHSQDESAEHDTGHQSGTESQPAAESRGGHNIAIVKRTIPVSKTEPIKNNEPVILKSLLMKRLDPRMKKRLIILDKRKLASLSTVTTPTERCTSTEDTRHQSARTLATRHLPSQHVPNVLATKSHIAGVSNTCTASRLATGSHTDSVRHATVSTSRVPDAYTVLPITTLPDTKQAKKVLVKRNIHEGAGTEHDASPATPAKKLKVVSDPRIIKILKGPLIVKQLPRGAATGLPEEAPS